MANNTYLKIKTPHYSFQMQIISKMNPYNSYHFLVGDKKSPCLEGNIILENTSNNERYNKYEYTATLDKIDVLIECSLEDISTEYLNTYSFGKEMLDSITFFINSQFPRIKTIKLTDMSFIPCCRLQNDILDLLTYSIALYGQTWYEKVANAYILPKDKYNTYRKQVIKYMDKKTKLEVPFELFYNTVINKNYYTRDIINNNYDKYNTLYDESTTFPEFFIKINKLVEKEDKCKFFRTWLYDFIESHIIIERTWYVDLYPKIEVISKSNYNKTRKNSKKQN